MLSGRSRIRPENRGRVVCGFDICGLTAIDLLRAADCFRRACRGLGFAGAMALFEKERGKMNRVESEVMKMR